MTNYCDICGRDAEVALVASGCAPVTYAACESCRGRGAEGIGVAALWWHLNGGGEAATAHLNRMTAWEDGAYVGADRILAYYEAHREELVALMSEEVELVNDEIPLDEDDGIEWENEGDEDA